MTTTEQLLDTIKDLEQKNTELRIKIVRLAERLDAQEEDLAVAESTWRCLHCGFKTQDEPTARAHWSEHGDLQEPVCVEWAKLTTEDERVERYQDMIACNSALMKQQDELQKELDAADDAGKRTAKAVLALAQFVNVLLAAHKKPYKMVDHIITEEMHKDLFDSLSSVMEDILGPESK